MKNFRKNIQTTIALGCLLLSNSYIEAQNVKQGIIPDTPPSPQAVAFNRLGDYQVNNNYGAPDINIPLFEIDFHGFKIPLTLHYEASPLKPGYNYDVTGLGWTLSGNSCVSRTIKDRPDEDGRFYNPFALDPFYDKSGKMKMYKDYKDELDRMNYQYDSYNIVLPSGRSIPFFMYKVDGVMIFHSLSLDSKVKISCKYTSNSIDAFTVTDENGVIYNFTLPEKASNIFIDSPYADKNVSWLLTSVDIPARGTILYQYTDPVTIDVQNILSEPVVTVFRMYDSWSVWPRDYRFMVKGRFLSQSPRYKMRFLSRIIYDSSTVDFTYADGRHMSKIIVKDCNETIRKYVFDITSSFLTSLVISGQNDTDKLVYGFTYSSNHPGEYTDYWGNRCDAGPSIKAENGTSLNNNGLNDVGNFNLYFGYIGIGLDWNDIKNKINNHDMLAQLIENEPDDNPYYYKLKLQTTTNGDTRKPTSPNEHGVLLSITYPNGGQTLFNWENHRFPTATSESGDIITDRRNQRIIEGGGFRIESITNLSKNGASSTDYYRYGFTLGNIIQQDFPLPLPNGYRYYNFSFNDTINRHIGCGEAVVDPNLFTFMDDFGYSISAVPGTNSSYSALYTFPEPAEFRKMLLGYDSSFKNISNNQGIPTWWEVSFSANKFRSLIGGRHPVVYPEITVYHGWPDYSGKCESKTVYRYDIYKYQYKKCSSMGNYLSTSYQVPDTAYFEGLYFDNEHPALSCCEYPSERHQLKSKSDYYFNKTTQKWELTSEEKYKYANNDIGKDGFIFESFVSRENYYPNYNDVGSNQMGYLDPLSGFPLRSFYKPTVQWIGRSELCAKYTTYFRSNGTCSNDNTKTEIFYNLYSGVPKERKYSDLLYRIQDDYGRAYDMDSKSYYDKKDVNFYVGEKYKEDKDNGEVSDSIITAMISRNMQASLLSSETYTMIPHKSMIEGSKISYNFFDNNILPFKISESNGDQYEESIEFLSYDNYGNPTEIVDLKTGNKQTGIHSVYLWDSYGRYMIAAIKNAKLSQIQDITKLRNVTSDIRYSMLKSLFPQSQIQTWDYKPLIGVSSFTDVNGQTIHYEYDGLGRLKSEKRIVNGSAEPEIMHEYEYNYMNR